MNSPGPEHQDAARLRERRWLVRTIGFGLVMVAGCAWLVRNDQPFLPAFALQTLAAFAFVALILAAVTLGVAVGMFVGTLNGVLGAIAGLVAGAGAFFCVGILSTEIPVIGPAIERIVSLIG